ncbi:MAG: hypothetical protein KC776_34675 [Myxococcales bacterium]|nr:hypothetical protein [Myxococcales bacterium]MCB9581899.1 hypothetical protein [Polyangiaceae bacterium]
MTRVTFWLLLLTLPLSACQKRSEPKPAVADETADAAVRAWGATLKLPSTWRGGENDAGGYELTDGELALLLGRHPGGALGAVTEDRKQALAALGIRQVTEATASVDGKAVRVLSGSAREDGGSVSVKLLIAPLGPDAALSVMLVGDASKAKRMDAAWREVLSALTLP